MEAAMPLNLLHELASYPWVYDRIQKLAGVRQVYARVSRQMSADGAGSYVLDVGGGTGAMRQLWPADCRYVCLDIEMPKLQGFRGKVAGGLALQTDATRMPIASRSANSVVCMAVAHHLTDAMLADVLSESVRVLKPGGRMFFLDAVFARRRMLGRMIWRLDRGSYPRTAEALRSAFGQRLKIAHWEQFAVHHEYVFGVGIKT
jgi:ubiquinone/menaquinone biosynthesis C-methylase UbiE